MPQGLIQIGPLIISKDVLDFLSPLIGTLIGGLITYLSIRASENRKRAQEKQDKIQDQRRESLKIALQWLDPIHNALTYVSMRPNPMDKDWPDLIKQLVKYDVPRNLAVFLPQDTYKRSNEIIRLIQDLRGKMMDDYDMHGGKKGDFAEYQKNIEPTIHELNKKNDELQQLLEEEYKKTFLQSI